MLPTPLTNTPRRQFNADIAGSVNESELVWTFIYFAQNKRTVKLQRTTEV